MSKDKKSKWDLFSNEELMELEEGFYLICMNGHKDDFDRSFYSLMHDEILETLTYKKVRACLEQ